MNDLKKTLIMKKKKKTHLPFIWLSWIKTYLKQDWEHVYQSPSHRGHHKCEHLSSDIVANSWTHQVWFESTEISGNGDTLHIQLLKCFDHVLHKTDTDNQWFTCLCFLKMIHFVWLRLHINTHLCAARQMSAFCVCVCLKVQDFHPRGSNVGWL